MPEVSTFKGQVVANIFSFFFAAGRACLMPFLTIYFYYLGLSPIQTGLLLGLKSFTSVWSALCWTKYIRSPKRKRCVLVFSIIVLMLTHLAMILMPTMNTAKASSFCPDLNNRSISVPCSNDSSSEELDCLSDFSMTSVMSDSELTDGAAKSPVTVLPNVEGSRYPEEVTVVPLPTSTIHVNLQSSVQGTTYKRNKYETRLDVTAVPTTAIIKTSSDNQDESFMTTVPENVTSHPVAESDADYNENADEFHIGKAKREIAQSLRNDVHRRSNSGEDDDDSDVTKLPDENNALSSEDSGSSIDGLLKSLNSIQHQVFVALLVLVLVGEMFSSPTEQLTEDLWLRFLDSFEKLDKIHIPRLWSSFGAALTPWAVVLLIDRLPCSLPFLRLPKILIHFFSFEIVIAMALLLAFCFPVTDSDGSKTKKWSRLARGLRAICGDVHSFVCMFTIIVVGFVYGFINTFLFWVMHENTDDGSELVLGISLTVASAGEFFMSFIVGWIVKKIKCPISIILGLIVLCARCLLYSFVLNPWIAVIGEGCHMLSHTIIWAAVRNYSAFRINPLVMDTSALSALGLVYSGFGIASGCMIAGLCYSWLGPKMMFQIAACVAGVWCILFAIIYKCCSQWKKQRVRYTKIAQDEIADSDASDDDWLDTAIKRKN